jgi:hypothetical protein
LRSFEHRSPQGIEIQVSNASYSSPEHYDLRVEKADNISNPEAEQTTYSCEDFAGERIPFASGSRNLKGGQFGWLALRETAFLSTL